MDALMGALMGGLIALGVVGIPIVLAWLGVRVRRRGAAGPAIAAAMAAYDQAMHVTAYDAFVEMEAQDDRSIPITTPDGPASGDRPAHSPDETLDQRP